MLEWWFVVKCLNNFQWQCLVFRLPDFRLNHLTCTHDKTLQIDSLLFIKRPKFNVKLILEAQP